MNRKNKHLTSVRSVRTMLLTAVMTIASLMAVFASGTVTLPNGWVFDADFYAALKHTSGVHYPASDDNGYAVILMDYQDELVVANVTDVNRLDVNGKNITSLQGIEYFTNLKTLYCSNNQLTTLDVSALSNLEN